MGRSVRALVILAVLSMCVAACARGGEPGSATSARQSPAITRTAVVMPAPAEARKLCDAPVAHPIGTITDPELREISGVVVSREQPGVLWVHNDSGTPNVIWALDDAGRVLDHFTVTDARAVDWEDIGIGRDHLFIADTGDNHFISVVGRNVAARSPENPARIYRVPEPGVGAGTTETEPAAAISIAYADGPRDAEALFVDPISGDGFIVSKQWDGGAAGLYRLPASVVGAAEVPSTITTLDRDADVAETAHALITGADISSDGTLVALRTYDAVLLWDRDPVRSIADTLAAAPTCVRTAAEPQGEAVGIGPGGRSLVTIGEGSGVPLNWVRPDAE